LTDQRTVLNLYGNGAVYHSAPFSEATEVSGQVKLSLWISLDVPDTDFQATLYEILPDGKSIFLTSDYLRARYRDSLEKETPVPLGQAAHYQLNGFAWFSRKVSKGSRLRLVVSCPNTIGLEKNYNSGGVVADETAKDARTAHVVLYHDAEHPSALEIPIVK
jgi:putative CocE/NonD family hydrolase